MLADLNLRDWYTHLAQTYGEKAASHATMFRWYVGPMEDIADAMDWHTERAYEYARFAAHFALLLL